MISTNVEHNSMAGRRLWCIKAMLLCNLADKLNCVAGQSVHRGLTRGKAHSCFAMLHDMLQHTLR